MQGAWGSAAILLYWAPVGCQNALGWWLVDYEAVIGMEVHAQILTRSKMFCGCSAHYASAPPNTHTGPFCLAMPRCLII